MKEKDNYPPLEEILLKSEESCKSLTRFIYTYCHKNGNNMSKRYANATNRASRVRKNINRFTQAELDKLNQLYDDCVKLKNSPCKKYKTK